MGGEVDKVYPFAFADSLGLLCLMDWAV